VNNRAQLMAFDPFFCCAKLVTLCFYLTNDKKGSLKRSNIGLLEMRKDAEDIVEYLTEIRGK